MYTFDFVAKDNSRFRIIFSGQLVGDGLAYSERIEKLLKENRVVPDAIIFLFPKYIAGKICDIFADGSRAETNITRYGKSVQVVFVTFDLYGDLEILMSIGPCVLERHFDELKRVVATRGIECLVSKRKSEVILRAPSGTTFIKPSGKEYQEFIKAGALAVGCSEVQFVAYCLLTKMPKNRELKCIYIDTSGISPFIESLIHFLTCFRKSECRLMEYRSFSSYGGLDEIPENVSDIWVIISASSSNSLGMEIAKKWDLNDNQIVTILSFSDSSDSPGGKIVTNIAHLSDVATETIARNDLIKVKLVGENFTQEIHGPKPILIKNLHGVPAIRALMRENYHSNLFLCNRRLSSGFPISSIYIDCENFFLKDGKFDEWLDRVMQWAIPANVKWLVYRGIDAASKNLVFAIERKLSMLGLNNISKIDINRANTEIKGGEAAIVAMPVTNTGETLLNLNRNLRISGHSGNRIFISPFVISSTKESFGRFVKSLSYAPNDLRYAFYFLHDLYIGHPERETSWELELKVVERLNHPFWRIRRDKLSNQDQGLNGFIGTPSLDVDEKLDFTSDFAFWDFPYEPDKVNHEAVYVTISSVLQSLRDPKKTNGADSLYSTPYQHAVISPENFTRFNDPLLQSCLWRSASSRELDYRSDSDLSQLMCNIILRLLKDNVQGKKNASVDLLIGIATGKISVGLDSLQVLLSEGVNICCKIDYLQELLLYIQRERVASPQVGDEGLAI